MIQESARPARAGGSSRRCRLFACRPRLCLTCPADGCSVGGLLRADQQPPNIFCGDDLPRYIQVSHAPCHLLRPPSFSASQLSKGGAAASCCSGPCKSLKRHECYGPVQANYGPLLQQEHFPILRLQKAENHFLQRQLLRALRRRWEL